jgi:hypothetical protein
MGKKPSALSLDLALQRLVRESYITLVQSDQPRDGGDAQPIYEIYIIGKRALKMRPPMAPRTLQHELLIAAGYIGMVIGYVGMRLFAGNIAELIFMAILGAGILFNILLLFGGHLGLE